MQSDGNSFGGKCVSDSLHKIFLDEDNMLDQKYKSKYVLIISYDSSLFIMIFSSYEFLVIMCCISLYMHFHQSIIKFKIYKISISI